MSYLEFVVQFPFVSAMTQFALLGTLGEALACCAGERRLYWPFPLAASAKKALIWIVLALLIKLAFIGFPGFVGNLLDYFAVASPGTLGFALLLSVAINLQFGPLLVILHRWLDNLAAGINDWQHLDKSLLSLLWFWIPAHTLTFMLPKPYQIGLAALWSLALGLLLGLNRKAAPDSVRTGTNPSHQPY
ncbi:hypothetical protein [Shewanella sedimentimangrovi]|uniref:Uncharacterized protein n=1 Tax=Shewanella sedimentimangrovi TaxID=2814293 RepID=A0ABX7R0L0_9GAMM|nr:hypothetical protein [Shewanella sedimentimangrovi]QSX37332.1 hypothetical protein JYB85_00270 [Shewanella sedimentimangrovi]